MRTKYTFLNENSMIMEHGIGYGIAMGGLTVLACAVISGLGALVARCQGDEKFRKKELRILRSKIRELERKIKYLTRLMKKEHLENKQNYYKKKIDNCQRELTKLLAQYKIVESMSLKDLQNLVAKRSFVRTMAISAIGGAALYIYGSMTGK